MKRALALVCFLAVWTASAAVTSLIYTPAPPDNPIKGFVPFQSTPGRTTFPHSMSMMYIAMRDLMTGPSTFSWTAIETQIQGATNEGCQFIFKIYLDFPGRTTGIPQYLLDGGLVTNEYSIYGNTTSVSPDWEDANLRTAMTNLISALGQQYDGDVRLGAVEIGFLGFWGEWHNETVPFASATVQAEVMDAHEAAFTNTKLLIRLPTTNNVNRPFGYNDDSFCADTLDPNNVGGFMLNMTNAAALDKWQTQMIGGEVYPALWYCIFEDPSCATEEYNLCVDTTHASWLQHSGAFSTAQPMTDPERAATTLGAQRLGYELYVSSLSLSNDVAEVTITNTGVAPFYYDWQVEVAAYSGGAIVKTWSTDWLVSGILPGAEADKQLTLTDRPAGSFTLLMRVVNPLPSGNNLDFANAEQDTAVSGWLTLGSVYGASITTPTATVGTLRGI